ncbi:MAG: type II toxin-antitoxin system RelE/ParE family toxin [Geobacteraceae bacterium]|nr:MAG: type II toxin-antitoxin system RelE/ParE family toxin [Geobacteraceae bacterium]
MVQYKVFFKKSVEKDLKTIPKRDLSKILEKIESLRVDPRPVGSEKLTGHERYRIRQGNYRIVYSIQDYELTVWVVKVGHRGDIYKKSAN